MCGLETVPVLKIDPVERWLRTKRPRTIERYRQHFRHFMPFVENLLPIKGPLELIKWAGTVNPLQVEELIEQFAAPRTAAVRPGITSALRMFFERNGVRLGRIPVEPYVSEFKRGYKRHEILSLLSFLDRDIEKLYVYFAKDTGLRANTLLKLRYRHVMTEFEAGSRFCHLNLEAEFYMGRKSAGRTFIGPDTVSLFQKVLKQRKTRKVKRDGKYQWIDGGPVIEPGPDALLLPFDYNGISTILRNARRKAQLDTKLQPSHGFRKFFENGLDKAEVDHEKKMIIEGHYKGVRAKHYTDRDIEELRPLYAKAYRFLDLTEQSLVQQRAEEIKQVYVAEFDDMKQRISRLEVAKMVPFGLGGDTDQ